MCAYSQVLCSISIKSGHLEWSILFHFVVLRRHNNPLFHARVNVISAAAPNAAIIGLSNFHTQLVEFAKRYDTVRICIRRSRDACGYATSDTNFPIKGENSGFSLFLRLKKTELQCRRHQRDSFLFVSPFQMCARPKEKDHGNGTRTHENSHTALSFFVSFSPRSFLSPAAALFLPDKIRTHHEPCSYNFFIILFLHTAVSVHKNKSHNIGNAKRSAQFVLKFKGSTKNKKSLSSVPAI